MFLRKFYNYLSPHGVITQKTNIDKVSRLFEPTVII
jgi:hypothetical protein